MISVAVVFTKPNEVAFREIEVPEPTSEEVLVRTQYSWISNGTEGSMLRGERIAGDTPWTKGDPLPFPIVPGYQKVGIVQAVGSEVEGLEVDDVVFATMSKVQGMFYPLGGHVAFAVTAGDQVWKLPKGLDPVAYSGLVLTQVGYNCGMRAPIQEGQNAVVVGDGLVGQWAAQTLAMRGATVVLVGRHADRLEKFSAGQTVDASDGKWILETEDILKGEASICVDTAGDISMISDYVAMLGSGGHLVSAGFYGQDDMAHLQEMRAKELSVDFVAGWNQPRMDETLKLVADGSLETLPLITHRFTSNEATKAWETITAKKDNALGVVLEW